MADAPANHQPPPPSSTTTTSTSDPQVQLEAKAEDAETRAAREELKQTVISDEQDPTSLAASDRHNHDMTLPGSGDNTPDMASAPPTSAAPVEGLRSRKRAPSPKKKRAHDQMDQQRDEDGHRVSSGTDTESWVMVDGDEKEAKQSSSSEPQKKRARDETSPPVETLKSTAPVATSLGTTNSDNAPKDIQQPQTSASAFAASGFSKLASSSASPFASIGGGANKSVFGGSGSGGATSSSPSPFAALAASSANKPATPVNLPKATLSFSNKDASAPSPFGALNGSASSGFGGSVLGGGGSVFGGGSAFASALGGSKISSFASPGAPLAIKNDKPAKPFGAPESDAEDEDGNDSDSDGDEAGGNGGEGEKDDAASRGESTPAAGGDEEKKTKYKRVVVDDGEAGEASIIQVRARMYYLDRSTNADGKEDIAWRERGAGILKVNVPVSSVVIDPETGVANPKSFDVSVLKESTPENPKLVRLLMRQDSTLRVILNSVMLAKMDFQLKEGLKAKSVLFTAIEGEDAKHVQVQMKMSPQSADTFLKAIGEVKKKLEKAEV